MHTEKEHFSIIWNKPKEMKKGDIEKDSRLNRGKIFTMLPHRPEVAKRKKHVVVSLALKVMW